MKQTTGPYPALTVDGGGSSVVPHAGATLLLRTAQIVGLPAALSESLAPWRKPFAIHDPAKIVLDLAVSLAIGGDCLADIAQLRNCPEVFGLVASDPTVSRCIDALAADACAALAAINTARAAARATAWALAGEHAPDVVVMDIRMPVMTGIEAARRILARRPETNVVLISMGAESEYPRLARQIGARAFIAKRNLTTSTLRGAMPAGPSAASASVSV